MCQCPSDLAQVSVGMGNAGKQQLMKIPHLTNLYF